MAVDEAYEYLETWSEMTQPEKTKKCKVLKKPQGGK
jgi:hypothetical protein